MCIRDRSWGSAILENEGRIKPPPVRLADGRTFDVRMESGLPAVQWAGLIRPRDLRGFIPIRFTMPVDGYVSVLIRNSEGAVVRQLLSCDFFPKGPAEVKWDGLGTGFYRNPGTELPAGKYTWSGIYHKGIGLRLRGWACNGGIPWYNGPGTGWGGDHGAPITCATYGDKVVLGWSGAEAGSAVVVCDIEGKVKWTYSSGGMCGCGFVAIDSNAIYVVEEKSFDPSRQVGFYRLEHERSMMITGGALPARIPACTGFDAADGLLFFSVWSNNEIRVMNASDGAIVKTINVPSPACLDAVSRDVVYVLSGRRTLLRINPAAGEIMTLADNLPEAHGVAAGGDGRIYVGTRGGDNRVLILGDDGTPRGAIGRQGERAAGPWAPEQMKNIEALAVDRNGRLWVMEHEMSPKRIVVWNTASGALEQELFGPTHYGASGAAICPTDPDIMIGEGCEWRLDPATGRSRCIGVIGSGGNFARFALGDNKRLYLMLSHGGIGYGGALSATILERVAEGVYRARARFYGGNEKEPVTRYWADRNDDQIEQADEVQTVEGRSNLAGYCGWAMYSGYDLTLYPEHTTADNRTELWQLKVTGFTTCGAPEYDLARPLVISAGVAPTALPAKVERDFPAMPMPSPDNRMIAGFGPDAVVCLDTEKKAYRWWYPCQWFGVHGSHYAPPAEPGLLRGVFGFIGSAVLPKPLGRVWVCNSNVGEWHMFSEDGYYVTRLFQGDPMKQRFPEVAAPGAILDNAPPGLGGEDFGGSFMQAMNGKVFCQAGKVGIWNVEVTGLENVKELGSGTVALKEADVGRAREIREKWIQENVGVKRFKVVAGTPQLNGTIQDFDQLKSGVLRFRKADDAEIYVRALWDEQNIYVCWEVRDATPWKNGAADVKMMYVGGDTVDFQVGANPQADSKRSDAVEGDMRLSIGPFQGRAVAVVYRRVSGEKKPAVFSSGVVKEYPMDYVAPEESVRIQTRVEDRGYVVQAAIPWTVIGVQPRKGLVLRADFGATHGDPGGTRTRLRTYWNNQHTGLVDDAVFELQMEPCNWGEIDLD